MLWPNTVAVEVGRVKREPRPVIKFNRITGPELLTNHPLWPPGIMGESIAQLIYHYTNTSESQVYIRRTLAKNLVKRFVNGERGGAKSVEHYVENSILEILLGSFRERGKP